MSNPATNKDQPTNYLRPPTNLMLLCPASGLLYSQKPKACSLPVAPWTLFQETTGPQVVRRCRTCRAGGRVKVFSCGCVDVWMCGCVDVWMCACMYVLFVCACVRVFNELFMALPWHLELSR